VKVTAITARPATIFLVLLGAIFLVVMIFPSVEGGGETYIVDDDGGDHVDFTSIQDAVDNATDGDTIRVYDGTYNESILIDRSLQIIGNGTNTTIMSWGSGWYAPFNISDGRIILHADNITLRDISVTSLNNYYSGPGILVNGNDSTIKDITVMDFLVSILLNTSQRSTISNNHLEGYYAGIAFLDSGNHILLENSYASMFWNFEIGMYRSKNITLNDCLRNTSMGKVRIENSDAIVIKNIPDLQELTIEFSSNITVQNTTSELTDTTITLTSSTNIHLMNNTMGSGGIGIWGESLEHWTTHTIAGSNTANGESYLYLTNRRGEAISDHTGPIILANCSDIQLSGINCNFTYAGVLSGFSSNITITHSNFRSNEYGVRFIGSASADGSSDGAPSNESNSLVSSWDGPYNNLIQNCTYLHNEIGLSLESSNDSLIRNCHFLMNNKGLVMYGERMDVLDNNITRNRENGIEILGGRGHRVQGNHCFDNGNTGIFISGSNDNVIQLNTCTENIHGIMLAGVENTTVEYNGCTGNWENGIFLDYSSYNYLRNNTLTFNHRAGLGIDHGRDNMILNHSISFNNYGVNILSSSYWNTIIDSYIHHNIIGIRISGSYVDENTIMNNVIVFNSEYGANVTLSPEYPIDLSLNWWGSSSGPYNPVENPKGTGDNITNLTEFSPWLKDWDDERFQRQDIPVEPTNDRDKEEDDHHDRILLYLLFVVLGSLFLLLIVALCCPSFLASRSLAPPPSTPAAHNGHDIPNDGKEMDQVNGPTNLAPPPPPSHISHPDAMSSIPCSHCGEMISLQNHADAIRIPCPHCGRESLRTKFNRVPEYQKLL